MQVHHHHHHHHRVSSITDANGIDQRKVEAGHLRQPVSGRCDIEPPHHLHSHSLAPGGDRVDAARSAEPGLSTTSVGRDDRHGRPGRAGQRLGLEVNANWSLVNRPPGAVGTWAVTIGISPCYSSQARWVP
jgi:hypothetical protein